MRFLRNILVVGLLGYGIGAGHEIVDLNFALTVGRNSLIYSVTDNGELNSIDLTIFGGLDNLCASVADLQLDISISVLSPFSFVLFLHGFSVRR